ncbi:MAG: Kelch repeat-containing protein [Actinomycetota bacterium]
MTPLADGRVLLAGGSTGESLSVEDAFALDLVARRWSRVESMRVPRAYHHATRLSDGRVLVTGGSDQKTGELFDPVAGDWSDAGPAEIGVSEGTSTLLEDGRVLFVGGTSGGHANYSREASVYDPRSRRVFPAAPMELARANQTATLLADGRVLVAGGRGSSHDDSRPDAAIYDPRLDAWMPAASLMQTGRALHTATGLPDGRVMLAGGTQTLIGARPDKIVASADIFDPQSTAFTPASSLRVGRDLHAAFRLPDGSVMVVAGFTGPKRVQDPVAVSSSEIYDLGAGRWRQGPPLDRALAFVQSVVPQGPRCGRDCGKPLIVAAGREPGSHKPVSITLLLDPTPASRPGLSPSRSGGLMPVAVAGLAAVLIVPAVVAAKRQRRAAQGGPKSP